MKGIRLPVPLRLYRGVTSAAALLTPAWLGYRVREGKEDPARLPERRGIASAARPRGPLIWVHGASVGEIVSVLPLIERLAGRGYGILLTSGTLTSSRIAARRAHPSVIHQFMPLDAHRFVGRFLDHWKPDLVLLAESELWPNLMSELGRRNTPLVLVNGRLSRRSAERWAHLPKSARALLSRVDLCLAQSRDDAARFKALGAPRVEVVGNLKFDAPAPPADAKSLDRMSVECGNRPIFLAASTHPGEDEIVLAAHQRLAQEIPDLLTIIAPRHPERGTDVRLLAEAAHLAAVQRSEGYLPDGGTEIYVADTIGELGLFYRLAPVVFMGGSLVRHGGQNPIEPAKLGAVALHGPHVWNFGSIYARLDERHGAALVQNDGDIAQCVSALLFDGHLHAQTAATARQVVDQLGGALDRTLSAIEPYLLHIRLAR
ncbi:MAG: 3-deoxy-D-manno-octulosonic acid transferase [Rhizobiales bacterium 24-66-13]|jgi:3-deoxy-D-manno-octulosonic-acid transferase|nr:MAG: 3-deoxy-D-manno-octulosonic acid transferase [Rhizobiales bacterium 24-66-13]OZB02879.1 MAG: 3-deoxy-D-manno-octulosonic acid transferase [Rhizobiales bacterium 39-66-18]HQS07393.1 3-deoxy-D-manno-octulosonic acid transferase [Xanthobacteraceae bacterium]HQS47192.1 3-deoxy-D-manno-octulosonic acid transferase [Xanthobacteraceae bacterium]